MHLGNSLSSALSVFIEIFPELNSGVSPLRAFYHSGMIAFICPKTDISVDIHGWFRVGCYLTSLRLDSVLTRVFLGMVSCQVVWFRGPLMYSPTCNSVILWL